MLRLATSGEENRNGEGAPYPQGPKYLRHFLATSYSALRKIPIFFLTDVLKRCVWVSSHPVTKGYSKRLFGEFGGP